MLKFGVVTDLHYADIDTLGTRYYRDALAKLEACVAEINHNCCDFMVELGDFKDMGHTPEDSLKFLQDIEAVFAGFNGPRFHVLGNHDLDNISKNQFMSLIENSGIEPGATYYSFDCRGYHLVVLDANYHPDGTDFGNGNFDWPEAWIPQFQLDWLENDLRKTCLPVIVLAHQMLDKGTGLHYVDNAAQVRQILEADGKVKAVFQGHNHKGGYSLLNGIHYCGLPALIEGEGLENNAYALVTAAADGRIMIRGYGSVSDRVLEAILPLRTK